MQSFTLYRESMVDLIEVLAGVDLALHEADGLTGALVAQFLKQPVRDDGWNEKQEAAFHELAKHEAVGDVLLRLVQPRSVLNHAPGKTFRPRRSKTLARRSRSSWTSC